MLGVFSSNVLVNFDLWRGFCDDILASPNEYNPEEGGGILCIWALQSQQHFFHICDLYQGLHVPVRGVGGGWPREARVVQGWGGAVHSP